MAGQHACQWSGGRQCWPCSSACQCRWTSIDYQWRLTALQLHECCHCLPSVDCKITLKLLLTMLSSLALQCRNWPWPICFNMQSMAVCQKICKKICRIWQKSGEYDKNSAEYDKNMQNNIQNMTKSMFKYAQYVIWYIVTYCNIFCIFYILQNANYVQDRPSHICLHIVLHIGLHTAVYYFAYSAYSAYCPTCPI